MEFTWVKFKCHIQFVLKLYNKHYCSSKNGNFRTSNNTTVWIGPPNDPPPPPSPPPIGSIIVLKRIATKEGAPINGVLQLLYVRTPSSWFLAACATRIIIELCEATREQTLSESVPSFVVLTV